MKLSTKKFWEIIDNVNASLEVGSQEEIFNKTKLALSSLTIEEICDWHAIFMIFHQAAYRKDIWGVANLANKLDFCSDDGFIDFRAWLISQGREVFFKTLENPNYLIENNIITNNSAFESEFETYNYVAYDAYAEKMATSSVKACDELYKHKLSLQDFLKIQYELMRDM